MKKGKWIIAILLIIAVLIGIYFGVSQKENEETKTPEPIAEIESEDIQDRIKRQEKIVETINQEIEPLMKEKEELEKKLMELTSARTEDK